MPSKAVLTEKQAIVAELTKRIQEAKGGLLVDYKGINVAQDTELRRDLRAKGVEYTVVKNTLTRLALDNAGLSGLDEHLNGTTSLATSAEDPLVAIHDVTEFAGKMNDFFTIKGVFVDGKVLTDAEVAELAPIPNRDALYSKVLGTMLAPITSLAVALGQVVEQGGGAPAAAEAAPAEEAAPAAEEAAPAPAAEAPAEAPAAE